jgi:hypothetical protein
MLKHWSRVGHYDLARCQPHDVACHHIHPPTAISHIFEYKALAQACLVKPSQLSNIISKRKDSNSNA